MSTDAFEESELPNSNAMPSTARVEGEATSKAAENSQARSGAEIR